MDRFRVDLIAATPHPQRCAYAAMHQDYSEGFVAGDREQPDEQRAGEICVDDCSLESAATTAPSNMPRSC